MVEMDRILRPEGKVVIRDSPEVLDKVARMAHAVRWSSSIHEKEPESHGREKILIATKSLWKLPSNSHWRHKRRRKEEALLNLVGTVTCSPALICLSLRHQPDDIYFFVFVTLHLNVLQSYNVLILLILGHTWLCQWFMWGVYLLEATCDLHE